MTMTNKEKLQKFRDAWNYGNECLIHIDEVAQKENKTSLSKLANMMHKVLNNLEHQMRLIEKEDNKTYVWVLEYVVEYEGTVIAGIYSSREKAREAKEKFEKNQKYITERDNAYFEITRMELDKE